MIERNEEKHEREKKNVESSGSRTPSTHSYYIYKPYIYTIMHIYYTYWLR